MDKPAEQVPSAPAAKSSSKRKNTPEKSLVQTKQTSADTGQVDPDLVKRRCVIFYNDHCSEAFMHVLMKLGIDQDRLREWYSKATGKGDELSDLRKRLEQATVKNRGAGEEEDEDVQDLEHEIEELECEIEDDYEQAFFGGSGFNFRELKGGARYKNDYGIVVGPWSLLAIKLKDQLPDGAELVLIYANSKNWDLAIGLQLAAGTWNCREWPEDAETKCRAASAYNSLRCLPGNFGVAYWGLDKKDKDGYTNSFDGIEFLEFDSYNGFKQVLGHDSKKFKSAWRSWSTFGDVKKRIEAELEDIEEEEQSSSEKKQRTTEKQQVQATN